MSSSLHTRPKSAPACSTQQHLRATPIDSTRHLPRKIRSDDPDETEYMLGSTRQQQPAAHNSNMCQEREIRGGVGVCPPATCTHNPPAQQPAADDSIRVRRWVALLARVGGRGRPQVKTQGAPNRYRTNHLAQQLAAQHPAAHNSARVGQGEVRTTAGGTNRVLGSTLQRPQQLAAGKPAAAHAPTGQTA